MTKECFIYIYIYIYIYINNTNLLLNICEKNSKAKQTNKQKKKLPKILPGLRPWIAFIT